MMNIFFAAHCSIAKKSEITTKDTANAVSFVFGMSLRG